MKINQNEIKKTKCLQRVRLRKQDYTISHKIRQGFKGDVGDVNATVANQAFNSRVDTRAEKKSYRGTDVVRVVVWASILTVASFYHTVHVHVPIQSSYLRRIISNGND